MPRHISPDDWDPKGVEYFEDNAWRAIRSTANTLLRAGPGAGKTELLAQRAAYLLETGFCRPPKRILAISFKTDAARNLKERVDSRVNKELARRFDSYTFDSFAKSLVDRFRAGTPPIFRPSENYNVEPALDSRNNLRDWMASITNMAPQLTDAVIQQLGIEFYQQVVIGQKLKTTGYGNTNLATIAAGAMWQYQLRRNPSVLNFPMIGRLAELILRSNSKIITALRATYAFVFLDEFQDTTQIQYDLTCTSFLGSDSVLTAVGDDKQRIMVWAGAVEGIFDEFQQDFAADSRTLKLNWRSAPELVRIQHFLIRAMDGEAELPESAPCNADKEGECKLLLFRDENHEAEHIAGIINEYINSGLSPRQIAILARQRVDPFTADIRNELAALCIKSRVENDYQDLLSEPIVELTLMVFEMAAKRRNPATWTRLIEVLTDLLEVTENPAKERKLSKDIMAFCKELRNRLPTIQIDTAVFEEIKNLIRFVGVGQLKNKYKQYKCGIRLQQITQRCSELLSLSRRNVTNWAEAIDDFRGINSVPILTIHKSKGLEYEAVFFLGLEDRALWGYRNNPDEEDCSFFVAFSRAKSKIIFTFAQSRANQFQSRNTIQPIYNRMQEAGIEIEEID